MLFDSVHRFNPRNYSSTILSKQMLRQITSSLRTSVGRALTSVKPATILSRPVTYMPLRAFSLNAPRSDRRTRPNAHTIFDDMRLPDMALVENMQFIASGHGANEQQRSASQRYIVSVQVEYDGEKAVYFDHVPSSISLGDVFSVTRDVVTKGKSYHTLDHMAHDIIRAILLKFPEAGAVTAEVSCPDIHRFMPNAVSHDAMLARAGEALCTLQQHQDRKTASNTNTNPRATAANIDLSSSIGMASVKQAGVRIRRQRTQLISQLQTANDSVAEAMKPAPTAKAGKPKRQTGRQSKRDRIFSQRNAK